MISSLFATRIRKVSLLSFALFLLSSWAMSGQDDARTFESNGIWYRVLKEADDALAFGTVSVSPPEFTEYTGDIDIPLTVKEFDDEFSDVFRVVAIDNDAFKGMKKVHSVRLPVSVEVIGDRAFQSCNAERIDIPVGNLDRIGKYAFAEAGITEIAIPLGVKSIGVGAFLGCRNLRIVSLGDNLRTIADSTFYQCTALQSISLPGRVTKIGNCAFLGCVNMKRFQFNDVVKSIGAKAFACCVSLNALDLPESLYEIGWGAFMTTSFYEITIPKQVKTLHKYLFYNSGIRQINLGEGISKIENLCFSGCSCFEASIPEGAELDEWAAFGINYGKYSQADKKAFDQEIQRDIKRLKGIVMEEDVTVLPMEDYGDAWTVPIRAKTIAEQIAEGTRPDYSRNPEMIPDHPIDIEPDPDRAKRPDHKTQFVAGGYTFEVLYSPEPGVEYGQLTLVKWNPQVTGEVRVPEVVILSLDGTQKKYIVTRMVSSTFSKKIPITSLEIGPKVRLGRSPFSRCPARTIKMNNLVLEERLFDGSDIESFEFPKGTVEIPAFFFRNCTELKRVTIPSSVTTIGKYAFSGCSALEYLDIPKGCKEIGSYAFTRCENLKTIVLPKALHTIQKGLFYECTNLTNVALPDSVTVIGESAFQYCSRLDSISIPEGVTAIRNDSFKYCIRLKAVSLPKSLLRIGEDAFCGCRLLTKVDLPDRITHIHRGAFYDCPIDFIIIPSSVSHMGSNAFWETKKAEIRGRVSSRDISSAFGKECVVDIVDSK